MKWYWIVLIAVSVLALGYLVWVNMPKKTSTTTPDTIGIKIPPGGTTTA